MKLFDYLNLTKPRISLLFAFTGLSALLMQGSVSHDPVRLWLIVLAIFMIGGAANALNQYFERDRDLQMARTAKKRPLPQGKISPASALVFSGVLILGGTFILIHWGTGLAAFLGIATILFYSFYYTLWLKPRTPYNIVIGGAAGATGPLIAWSALTGSLAWPPFLMFLIIFFWTPPHFWALALCCKDDYSKVGLPMLPLVAGDEFTRKQILYYSLTLPPLVLSLYLIHALGLIYLVTGLVLSLLFVAGAFYLKQQKTLKSYWQFFAYSIIYLLLLFAGMIVDVLV